MERGRRPRKRRDLQPRSVVDFTGGPVADLTLRSTPDGDERTPDWEWPSINLSIHPTIKNVRTTVATPNPVAIAKPGTNKNARSATIRRKKEVRGFALVNGRGGAFNRQATLSRFCVLISALIQVCAENVGGIVSQNRAGPCASRVRVTFM